MSHSRPARKVRADHPRRYPPLLVELEPRVVPGFLGPLTFPVGSNPDAVAVGDFNGDGIPDLVVANQTSLGTLRVLLGNGDGSFQGARSVAAGSWPYSVAVGDFNGDGIPDLVVANDV